MKTNVVSDEIWSIIRETQKNIRETQKGIRETRKDIKELSASQKETDKQIKRFSAELSLSQKETDQSIKELSLSQKETGKLIKENSKGLRGARDLFTSQWGRLIESLVEGDLVKLLNEKGIEVDSTLTNMKGQYEGVNWEFDIVAVNGREVVLVEVKTVLKVRDVDHFKKKLKVFTSWRPEYRGKRVYGAVAYLRAGESSSNYAENQGLFVIRATGNSSSIINKKGFKPKVFL